MAGDFSAFTVDRDGFVTILTIIYGIIAAIDTIVIP